MPTITDNAVCIRHWDFSETSQTVSLLTREHGVLRGLAKGAKRERGSFSGGIDVLTRGQVVAIVKPGRDLATLTQWTLEELFWSIRNSLEANRAGLYMADLVDHLLTDHDPHAAVFDMLVESLRALETPADRGPALLRFQWGLLREAGYQPELARDATTGQPLDETQETFGFNPRAGGLVKDTGAPDRWRVRRETVLALRAVADRREDTALDAASVHRANRLLASYIRDLSGQEPPSMRWAFSDLV